jgi:YfiH family protein
MPLQGPSEDGPRFFKPPLQSNPMSEVPENAGPGLASGNPGIVRVEAWARYPWLRAGFSTRHGGRSLVYSDGLIGEQNLGWTDADAQEIVEGNRRRFLAEAAGGCDFELVTTRQTHGAVIQQVAGRGPFETRTGRAVLSGDGLMTSARGLLLGVQTADCVPVLLADTRKRVVAAFHAGWRGTLARIVEKGVGEMRERHGSKPGDLVAAIGPAIARCCFEVGEDVRTGFEGHFEYASSLFQEVIGADGSPQLHQDLFEANRRQLLDAGVSEKHITIVGECTVCTRVPSGQRKYFSHRAERGHTGRMLSVIGVAAS